MFKEDLRAIGIEGWRRKVQDRLVEANSTGGEGSRRAVEPGGGESATRAEIFETCRTGM